MAGIPKKDKKDKKPQRATAFFNWEYTAKNGRVLKSDKGFPIFQNEKYPSLKEDLLVEGAKLTEDKVLILENVTVRVALNKPEPDEPLTAENLF
jgi:hypothetical protein